MGFNQSALTEKTNKKNKNTIPGGPNGIEGHHHPIAKEPAPTVTVELAVEPEDNSSEENNG